MTHRSFIFTIVGIVVVTAFGSLLDVMEVDAAQYASMSQELMVAENWTHLFHRGQDYLDKPPLLFWLSALSFKLFGVSNWSYKLPSILFAFLGIFSTYRFSLIHYSKDVARSAAIMFGSSAAFLLMTNDVRCDTVLTGAVITAIWTGSAWIEQRRWWQVVICALAIAAGMLAKGPMGLMAPMLALGGHVVLARKWDALRDLRWLVALPIVALLLVPMCIGLYEQFGAHGIRFYFWEQSFGRLTGENRWKDDSTVFFFSHEVIWQLLPWTVFVLAGIWIAMKEAWRRNATEYISISGVVLVFVAISFSQFKLPHYMYVIVPLFAVRGAQAWHTIKAKWVMHVHFALLILVWIAGLGLTMWSFPAGAMPFGILLLIALVTAFVLIRKDVNGTGKFLASWCTMIAVSVVINLHVYPQLLAYQANAQAGKWAAENGYDSDHFFGMQQSGTALDFYAGFPVKWLSDAGEAQTVLASGVAIYTDQKHAQDLIHAGFTYQQIFELSNFKVQLLNWEMLDPQRRKDVVDARVILVY